MKKRTTQSIWCMVTCIIAHLTTTSMYAAEETSNRDSSTPEQSAIQQYEPAFEHAIKDMAVKEMQCLSTNIRHKDGDDSRLQEYKLQIEPCLQDASTLVYTHKGIPVGFICYSIQEPAWYALFARMAQIKGLAEIHFLVVDEAFRRRGIGGQLMKAALEECRKKDVDTICLGTTGHTSSDAQYNATSSKYYEKFGFSPTRFLVGSTGPIKYHLSNTRPGCVPLLQKTMRFLRLIP